MASTSASLSPETSTVAPLPAPRVMIISAEPASTGSPPGTPISTSESSSPAASEMIAAGRAWRPTAEPTATDLVGMGSPSGLRADDAGWWWFGSDSGDVGVDGPHGLGGDHGDRAHSHTDGERHQVAENVVHREEHEDAAVWCPHADVQRLRQRSGDGASEHDGRDHPQ